MSKDLKARIRELLRENQRKVKRVGFFIKLVLVAGGALLAGAAAFFNGSTAVWSNPSTWGKIQIVGLTGVTLTFLGALFIYMTEDKPGAAFDAHEALTKAEETATERDDAYQLLEAYEQVSKRVVSLYLSYSAARGVLEQAAVAGVADEVKLVDDCLWSMKQDLLISLGFNMSHTWTICVYQRKFNETDSYNHLHCVAHQRAIECNLKEARSWKEGVGVGGMALAKDGEVVAPDILSDGAGSLFKLSGDIVRTEDLVRYRSMMAVPVSVDGDCKPWGVVLASCDAPHHFGAEDQTRANTGLRPEEAVRTLASVVALAIAICRCNTRSLPGPGEDSGNSQGS